MVERVLMVLDINDGFIPNQSTIYCSNIQRRHNTRRKRKVLRFRLFAGTSRQNCPRKKGEYTEYGIVHGCIKEEIINVIVL
jgi:hypothetical protein